MGKHFESHLNKLSAEQSAYLAGVIDCDGWISWKKDTNHWRIGVGTTSKKLIDLLMEMTGKSNVYVDKRSNRKWSDGSKRKDCYFWEIFRIKEVIDLLKAIIPYLTIKKKLAKTAYYETKRKLSKKR